eukprot:6698871-Lingulodinium_polyedra.AAC.1
MPTAKISDYTGAGLPSSASDQEDAPDSLDSVDLTAPELNTHASAVVQAAPLESFKEWALSFPCPSTSA